MFPVPSGVRVWLAIGVTDMRRGMNSLALQVQEGLGRDPHAGDLFCVPGPQRSSCKDSLARRARLLAVRQATGARALPLAVGDGRRRGDQPGAARLHAGGDRLAEPAADLASTGGGMTRTVSKSPL